MLCYADLVSLALACFYVSSFQLWKIKMERGIVVFMIQGD